MSLRFFADHCISNFVIATLRQASHQVFRLKEHVPADSPDALVIAKAQELDAILVSLDGDFADIVRYPPANYKGIIALQVRGHPETIPHITLRLSNYLSAHEEMTHFKGKLFLVEAHRIRVRT